MPDYQKGKIYKLWSPSKNLVYYGSTVETLASRLSKHIYTHKKYKEDNNNGYCSSYLVIECGDYKMELLEEYACNNKSQLCKKEGEYQQNNECVNNQIAGRTTMEKDNPDWWKEYGRIRRQKEGYKEDTQKRNKEYYEKNKEELKERCRIWRENNPEKVKEHNQSEERKAYKKEYSKQYREKLKQKQQEIK